MFTIKSGKENFTQWDLNQQIMNPCMADGDEITFSNGTGATIVQYARTDGSDVVVDVPNILLQDCRNIVVNLEQGNDRHMECRTVFPVEAAVKPEDYVFADNVRPKPPTIIDPKCLPGVVLPVVELTTVLEYYGYVQNFNDADNQKLNEMEAAMCPFIAKMRFHHSNDKIYDIASIMTIQKYAGDDTGAGTDTCMTSLIRIFNEWMGEIFGNSTGWTYRGVNQP